MLGIITPYFWKNTGYYLLIAPNISKLKKFVYAQNSFSCVKICPWIQIQHIDYSSLLNDDRYTRNLYYLPIIL